MNRNYLGEFEELVLLAVAVLDGQAYGVALLHELTEKSGRQVRLNQVHSALQRLEEKGMLRSAFGEPTSERGGKRKRVFTVTALGQRTLHEIQEVRSSFWGRLANFPKLSITG
ncbi:PadR family transcriptional regulator [Dyadobacter luticola]|uniref:PadR family transcriptional regulator n=1 Tax=Dyadobacter luticola TaxID=1979387 RepID=A0A5R9KLB3_9BACT|nr:helix-turn-helix transcriptional regulator [Dyadobacter luticola]TLU96997.1 PadR family transcriptional regulator [Dyadobacter luticola]